MVVVCAILLPNTKTPPGISSKRGLRAPDGNRTMCDYQLVILFTSGFASGKGYIFIKSAFYIFTSLFSFSLAGILNVTGMLGVFS